MRPPQSKTHRHHESPFDYRKGEHLSMDPVGPVKVPAPLMVYGDKSTGHISVQLYKSELLSLIPCILPPCPEEKGDPDKEARAPLPSSPLGGVS
jgi:hypothetical protein